MCTTSKPGANTRQYTKRYRHRGKQKEPKAQNHLQNSPGTSLDATTQTGKQLQLLPRGLNLDSPVLMRKYQPAHRALAEEMAVQRFAVLVGDGLRAVESFAGEIEIHELQTVGSTAGKTVFALPAWGKGKDYRVAWLEGCHVCAYFFDCVCVGSLVYGMLWFWFGDLKNDGGEKKRTDACGFVTGYHGWLEHETALLSLDIGVTY